MSGRRDMMERNFSIGPTTWATAGGGEEMAAWQESPRMETARAGGRSERERKSLQVGSW